MPDISSPPERTEELVERMARAMLAVDGSWQGISWERVPDAVQALFLRNARAALQSLGYAEMGWQPIETAPKDGRFVMLHCPNGQLESGDVTIGAYWKEDERAENGRFLKGHWDGWLGMDVDIASSWCDPTHWMPLPDPPQSRS